MRKIELHWDTRNEYVLTANELKSLEEKHRRDLERRKKEEEEKKKKLKAQVSDLQKHGGISQNFVSSGHIKNNNSTLKNTDGILPNNSLNTNLGISLSKNISVSVPNISKKNNKL